MSDLLTFGFGRAGDLLPHLMVMASAELYKDTPEHNQRLDRAVARLANLNLVWLVEDRPEGSLAFTVNDEAIGLAERVRGPNAEGTHLRGVNYIIDRLVKRAVTKTADYADRPLLPGSLRLTAYHPGANRSFVIGGRVHLPDGMDHKAITDMASWQMRFAAGNITYPVAIGEASPVPAGHVEVHHERGIGIWQGQDIDSNVHSLEDEYKPGDREIAVGANNVNDKPEEAFLYLVALTAIAQASRLASE